MIKVNREYKCQDCGHIEDDRECPKCNGFMRTFRSWGTCECGKIVSLGGFTNTCENCGRDYDSSGQELAPRYFWGEETNETLDDILKIR